MCPNPGRTGWDPGGGGFNVRGGVGAPRARTDGDPVALPRGWTGARRAQLADAPQPLHFARVHEIDHEPLARLVEGDRPVHRIAQVLVGHARQYARIGRLERRPRRAPEALTPLPRRQSATSCTAGRLR